MLFSKFRQRREEEQKEYDDIIQQAQQRELASKAAERSAWGCAFSLPKTLSSRVFTSSDQMFLEPLLERARCTSNYPSLFEDKAAVQVAETCCTSEQVKSFYPLSYLHAYEQSHYIAVARNFLKRNPKANIVEINCGLSTLYYQLDNKRARWIELDSPEVLKLRKDLGFDQDSRINQVVWDSDNTEWTKRVLELCKAKNGFIFIAAIGENWPAKKVKELVCLIKATFANALVMLKCCGGKAGNRETGFHLFDLNAKSVFHFWFKNDPSVQVFDTAFPPKEALEDIDRANRKKISKLYRQGNQILVDLKFAQLNVRYIEEIDLTLNGKVDFFSFFFNAFIAQDNTRRKQNTKKCNGIKSANCKQKYFPNHTSNNGSKECD